MAQSSSSTTDLQNTGQEEESKSAHSADARRQSSKRNDSVLPTFPTELISDGDPAQQIPTPPLSAKELKRFVKVKEEYELKDFSIKVKLGKGAFGNVYLVELVDPRLNGAPKQTEPMQFAMKVIDKATIFTQQLTKYAKTERDILALFTESNFLVKLYFAF